MSIYSVNRTGSMALAQVAANESYTSEDFGRILYETQVNDMAFFEAILACDFNEIKGLREGTLLESEVEETNKVSFKAIVEKLCTALEKFWGKVKALLQSARERIAAWTDTGKKTVKRFEEKAGKKVKSWTGKVEKVATYDLNHKCLVIPNDAFMGVEFDYNNNENTNEFISDELSYRLGIDNVSLKEFPAKALEVIKDEVDLTAANVDDFKEVLYNASSKIAELKRLEKSAENSIGASVKKLRANANNSDDAKANIARLNSIVHGYQTLVATIAKTAINAVRADLKSRNAALIKAMNDICKVEEAVGEAYVLEANDAFDEFMINESVSAEIV